MLLSIEHVVYGHVVHWVCECLEAVTLY